MSKVVKGEGRLATLVTSIPNMVVVAAKIIEPPTGVETPGMIEKPYPGGTPVTDPVVVLEITANNEGVTMYPPP